MVFCNKPHTWTEKLRIGYRKGYSMDHYGTEAPQPTSRFNMTDRLTQSSLSVAQHCSDLVLNLSKFRNFILQNIALAYFLTEYIPWTLVKVNLSYILAVKQVNELFNEPDYVIEMTFNKQGAVSFIDGSLE